MLADFIYYLTAELNWTWLDLLICTLCDLEMQIPLLLHPGAREDLNTADIGVRLPNGEITETTASQVIPKDLCYCNGCPFHGTSKIAKACFGSQMSGYCYYLARGDYSFIRPTDLLWDGCKECGVNTDEEYDNFPEEFSLTSWDDGDNVEAANEL